MAGRNGDESTWKQMNWHSRRVPRSRRCSRGCRVWAGRQHRARPSDHLPGRARTACVAWTAATTSSLDAGHHHCTQQIHHAGRSSHQHNKSTHRSVNVKTRQVTDARNKVANESIYQKVKSPMSRLTDRQRSQIAKFSTVEVCAWCAIHLASWQS